MIALPTNTDFKQDLQSLMEIDEILQEQKQAGLIQGNWLFLIFWV
jgi:hypothetical protein